MLVGRADGLGDGVDAVDGLHVLAPQFGRAQRLAPPRVAAHAPAQFQQQFGQHARLLLATLRCARPRSSVPFNIFSSLTSLTVTTTT